MRWNRGERYLLRGAREGSMLEALADPLAQGSGVLYALEGDAVLLHPLLVTSQHRHLSMMTAPTLVLQTRKWAGRAQSNIKV